MLNCEVLTPAFCVKNCERSLIGKMCAEKLGVDYEEFELFALVPLREVENPDTVVIRLRKSGFSLAAIEKLLEQREQLAQQLNKTKEALTSYAEKIQEKKEPVIDEKITRKVNKLEEDNKKLRQLLKYFLFRTQLDNAENLRLATQRTVENLREEFDLLVRELLNVKKAKEKVEETPKTEKKPTVPKLKIGAN